MNSSTVFETDAREERPPPSPRGAGVPFVNRPRAAVIVAFVITFSTLTLLVYYLDAPLVLAVVFLLAAGTLLLVWPQAATLLMVFLLYTNIPVVAYKYHGIPKAAAGAFILLLLLPLGHYVIRRREPVRVDRTFHLMLLFLAVLLIASFGARGLDIAAERIQTYVVEGLVLYWLVINTIRDLPTLRRVIWTLLAAGSLLGSLSLYQEVTGSFDQQFGGLAHRNYEFLILQQQITANPDDPVLREQKMSMRDGRSGRAEGPMDEPNAYAQILLVLLPLAFFAYRTGASRRSRFCAVMVSLLILGGIIVSQSRGALVALVLLVILATYLKWIRPVQLMICALALISLILIVAPERLVQRIGSITTAIDVLQGNPSVAPDPAIQGRATEMLAAFQAFVDHPVLGVGPGQYAPFYSVEYHQKNPRFKFKDIQVTRRAHSLYLEMAAEVGLVGLTVFLLIVCLLIRELWRIRRRWLIRRPELTDLATGLLLSITAYLTTAVFLHLAYERYYWLVLALAGAALQVARSEARATVIGPTGLHISGPTIPRPADELG